MISPKPILLAAALTLVASLAQAATVTYTEGKRETVLGSTKLGDVKGAPSRAFDTGSFAEGDTLNIHGRMVGAVDTYAVGTTGKIQISFLFNGFQTAVGLITTSGFIGTGRSENTSVFRLLSAANPSEVIAERTFTSGISSEAENGDSTLIFSAAPGAYLFQIDGSGQGNRRKAALYDVQISSLTAVPLPASSLLLLGGLGALGAMRRKAKKA